MNFKDESRLLNDLHFFFITGGHNGTYLSSTEFVHSNGTVSAGPSLPYELSSHCMATLFDGRVIILGGGTTGQSPDQGQRNVLIYDPIDESFTPGPEMENAYYAHACALFKSAFHNNREVVLVAGGASDDRTQLWDYQTEGSGWISSKWNFFLPD